MINSQQSERHKCTFKLYMQSRGYYARLRVGCNNSSSPRCILRSITRRGILFNVNKLARTGLGIIGANVCGENPVQQAPKNVPGPVKLAC